MPMIVVTGATGNIGGALVRELAERGAAVRALSRDPPAETGPVERGADTIDWVAADLADRNTLPPIFDGADRLFLLTGNVEDMVRLQKNAIAAARDADVGHVVKLSALGASDHSKSVIGLWHHNVERALRESGLAWTILRPHVFMQNLLEQREAIRTERRVRSPSGAARIPMIDTRDIAAAAAATLTESDHEGKRYTLTGPEPISYAEATEIVSEELDEPLEYVAETEDEAWHRLHSAGLPAWLIGARLALAAYQRAGGGTEIVTDTVEELSGRPARKFREFARDYADRFR